jgi:hypothetical protein
MDIQPLELAERLKQEADMILELIHMDEILLPYGRVYPTGSYFLNVMVYPDIDLYIPTVSVEQIFAIGAKIATCDLVRQVVYEPSNDPVLMPHGLYLKTRVNYGVWGRPWKIDLWSLPEDMILQNLADMQHFQQALTAELREQIIRYKLSVMTAEKRTPKYSGYYIYKAFIDERLTDFSSVTRYLVAHGIQIEDKGNG